MPLTLRRALATAAAAAGGVAAAAAGLTLGVPAAAVAAACSVEVEPVAFGTVDGSARQSRGTGEVVVRCDGPADFAVGLSPGRGGGDGRRMDGPGGARLDYALFADAGYSIPWGDGRAIGNPVAGRASGDGPVRLTIYGLVPRQPGALPGEYADSLQVTLTF